MSAGGEAERSFRQEDTIREAGEQETQPREMEGALCPAKTWALAQG